MEFTINFLFKLGRLIFYGLPLFITFFAAISVLSIWIGNKEDWTISDSLYFGFITTTTVGYGDYHPKRRRCKFVAIVIALLGLMVTGILVAVAVEAIGIAAGTRGIPAH